MKVEELTAKGRSEQQRGEANVKKGKEKTGKGRSERQRGGVDAKGEERTSGGGRNTKREDATVPVQLTQKPIQKDH